MQVTEIGVKAPEDLSEEISNRRPVEDTGAGMCPIKRSI